MIFDYVYFIIYIILWNSNDWIFFFFSRLDLLFSVIGTGSKLGHSHPFYQWMFFWLLMVANLHINRAFRGKDVRTEINNYACALF